MEKKWDKKRRGLNRELDGGEEEMKKLEKIYNIMLYHITLYYII